MICRMQAIQPQTLCYRNKDFQEVTLEKDGVVLLSFASTYGFRNIQNLVQKLKRGKSPYHFVEVMACPAGKWKYAETNLPCTGAVTHCYYLLHCSRSYFELFEFNIFYFFNSLITDKHNLHTGLTST